MRRLGQGAVLVNEVYPQQEIPVSQRLFGSCLSDDFVVFTEDEATVCDAVQDIQVMRGVHDGLTGVLELLD
jgi:hypothetical protein